jgi:diguanylate cyclase (GGDEF)-like protein
VAFSERSLMGHARARMDTASQITFGYYTTALIAMAALALASGVQFAVVGVWRYRNRLYLSYALLCVCISVLAFCNARLNTAISLPAATRALRVMLAAAILSFPAFVAFIDAYTGKPFRPLLVGAVGLGAAWFLWLDLSSPTTLLFRQLGIGSRTVLPWGETLLNLNGAPSTWGWVFHALTYALFFWALLRALNYYRQGAQLRATLLAACLLVQFGALLWGDILVDALGYNLPYLDGFAFLPFVLWMGISLASQLHMRTLQLEQTTRHLRAEADIRRDAELRLRHVAHHDALTGLPNRLHALNQLGELLAEMIANGQHGAALIIDLDNFKTINDGLGHHVGDRLLEAMSDRLLAAAPADAIVARMGGDEFAVLLGSLAREPHNAAAQVEQVAARLIKGLAAPIAVDSRMLAIGASVGVALFPSGDASVADIVRRADIALYRAKSAGRNAVRLFLPHMQKEVDDRLVLERGLRTALEHGDMAQFQLHYQPQLGPHGMLIGAEALLRWQHPQLGNVPPDVFIPIAEETGLIHALGLWVVAEACARMRAWDRAGIVFGDHLAVNVSAWQLAHPHFIERIEAQVRQAGIAPSRLTLELTESVLLQGFETTLDTLRKLSDSGFRLAMDDFGTGYSSLSYLQQLPLDVLKIDRSFISGQQGQTLGPLAAFIIDVGNRLGLTSIAEGVETPEQQAALERLGCDGMQGYLICRPISEPEFVRWLARHALEQRLQPAGAD